LLKDILIDSLVLLIINDAIDRAADLCIWQRVCYVRSLIIR